MQNYAQPQLTLDQAYEAAFFWLGHIDQPPAAISEPTDGVIEMKSNRLLARVRWGRSPINQAAVLAILRVPVEGQKRVVFSVTGFTPGAVSLADTQAVALFTFDEVGMARPENAHAIALVPGDPPEPPFAPHDQLEDERPETTQARQTAVTYDLTDWIECPTCSVSHHRAASFCRACGSKLGFDGTSEPPPVATHHAAQPPAAPLLGGPASPLVPPGDTTPRTDRQTTLRCRTCGSHDIELLRP
jgi:hypothetical protein